MDKWDTPAKGGPAPYDPAVAGFAANGYGEHSPGRYNLIAAFLVEVVLTKYGHDLLYLG